MQQVSVRIVKVIAESICQLKGTQPQELQFATTLPNLSKMKDSDWISWTQFTEWIGKLNQSSLAPIDWRQVGITGCPSKNALYSGAIIRNSISLRSAYWIAAMWYRASHFRVIQTHFEDTGVNRIRETLEISPLLEPCPDIFLFFEGAMRACSKAVFNLPYSEIHATYESHRAVYDIILPKQNSFFQKIIYAIACLKNHEKLREELGAAQAAVNEQTNKLIHERSEFNQLISGFPDGVMIHRLGTIVYANQQMANFLGCRPEDLIGKNAIELAIPDQWDAIRERLAKFQLDPNFINEPFEVIFNKFGSEEKIHGECTSMYFSYEGNPAVAVVTRDISDRKKNQSLLLATDRLTSLGQLAAGVGHEVNNPLNYVLIKFELINEKLKGHIDASLQKEIDEVNDGLNRIQKIVKDLKAFSRGNHNEKTAPVFLQAPLRTAISIATNEIKHRAQLIVQIDDLPQVNADEAHLGQVFLNILINAAQSIEVGHANANKITVKGFLVDQMVTIQISDTGKGIPEESQKNLFKPFYTTKNPGEGTGFGLSICQTIVSRYQGTMAFESIVDVGTTFTISFPRVQIVPKIKTSESVTVERNADIRGRVLLIDDDEILLETFESIVKTVHETVALRDANLALTRIREGEAFDVILCDLMMPNMGGIEFYNTLRETAPEMCERVLFLTGGSFTDNAEAFLSQPGIRYLQKPIRRQELLRVLRESIRT